MSCMRLLFCFSADVVCGCGLFFNTFKRRLWVVLCVLLFYFSADVERLWVVCCM